MAKRDSNEESLGQAIERLLKVYQLDGRVQEAKVINGWEKLLGPVVAKHTGEIFIKDRVLHVRLDSAALRQELSFGRSRIVEMLNKEAGSEVITDVLLK